MVQKNLRTFLKGKAMTKTPEELTADWKEGLLEYGQYWVKNKVWEKPFIDRWLPNCSWQISCKDTIEQVLAPVPSYDEYKAMQDELAEHRENCCYSKNEVLRLKLAEMEELLRECIAHLSLGEIGTSVTPVNILLDRINTALNETQANQVDNIKIQETRSIINVIFRRTVARVQKRGKD